MKNNVKIALILILISVIAASSVIISRYASEEEEVEYHLDCFFTELDWDATIEDVIAYEGTEYSTYYTVYEGDCYSFTKEYNGKEGTIKYMFDADDNLVCVAWAYSPENSDKLYKMYNDLHELLVEQYGESDYDATGVGNYGDVWYPETGSVLISVMNTDEYLVLQCSFMHPSVSRGGSSEE